MNTWEISTTAHVAPRLLIGNAINATPKAKSVWTPENDTYRDGNKILDEPAKAATIVTGKRDTYHVREFKRIEASNP
jgi:hypothetical protein